jgi:ribosomal protein S18 acetylase RimI-like enzyme
MSTATILACADGRLIFGPMITYTAAGSEALDRIEPLWNRLVRHHAERSPHFAAEIGQRTWAGRRQGLLAKAAAGRCRVDCASDASERLVGCCVATITSDAEGEIDSLFVDDSMRGRGIGDALMVRALAWMDEHAVRQKKLMVAFGNEEVFRFYEKYGFLPRETTLIQRG